MFRQNLLPDNDKQSFYWFLWHELGHWYTRNTEPDDLRRYSNLNLLDAVTLSDRLRGVNTTITQLKQDGYWFWQEFIAEAISQYVSGEYDAQQFDTSQPIEWRSSAYLPIILYLDSMLDAAFSPDDLVDEYALTHYFANLLMRDVIVLFEKAAEAGELIPDTIDGFEIPDVPDASMDPTRISDIEFEEFQPAMRELHKLLKYQVQKERFWEVDENFLLELGRHIKNLVRIHKAIASLNFADRQVNWELSKQRIEPYTEAEEIKCSFCGKSSNEVEKMIVASDDVCICNECVGLCSEVLQEEIDKK